MVFGFVAGMAMARCFQLRPAAGRMGGPLAWAAIVFIAASLTVAWANMFVVFGFTALIFALAYQQGAVNTLMSSGPAMFLGRISFSLYMIHYVPLKMSLWLLQTQLGGSSLTTRLACLVAIPLLCLGLAVATHQWLEVPFQRQARAVLGKGRDSRVGAVLAS
jgi:peptidoglycan/LPS O-acetylase OafA/YrhL